MSAHDAPSCLFCRIGAGQAPAHVLYASERVLAFLDIHPLRPGRAHAHVVPLVEDHGITSRRYIAEPHLTFQSVPRASDDALAQLARRIAAALEPAPEGREPAGSLTALPENPAAPR